MSKWNKIEIHTDTVVADDILHDLSTDLYSTLKSVKKETWVDDVMDFNQGSIVIVAFETPYTAMTFKKIKPMIRKVFKGIGYNPKHIIKTMI